MSLTWKIDVTLFLILITIGKGCPSFRQNVSLFHYLHKLVPHKRISWKCSATNKRELFHTLWKKKVCEESGINHAQSWYAISTPWIFQIYKMDSVPISMHKSPYYQSLSRENSFWDWRWSWIFLIILDRDRPVEQIQVSQVINSFRQKKKN